MKNRGILYIISGPSGSGKDTLISELLQKDSSLHLSISTTTRAKREGEIDGKHYNFVSKEHFADLIDNDRLLEYAEYCNNFYGTPFKKTDEYLAAGINVILNIETKGAKKIKDKLKDTVLIFIMPPSAKELEKRLRERKTDSEEEIEKRLIRAKEEIDKSKYYDFIVINDDLKTAVEQLYKIINK